MTFVIVLAAIAIVSSFAAASEVKKYMYQDAYVILQFCIICMLLVSIAFAWAGKL